MAKQSSCLKSFEYMDKTYFYEVKNVKYLRLKIDKNKNLKLSIPRNLNFDFVYEFLDKNQKWINKNLNKINLCLDNDFYLLGKKYQIIFDEKNENVKIFKNEICAKDEKNLNDFLEKISKNVLRSLVNKWLKITKLSINHLSIKKMKSRWGSCNSKKAYINLNSKLIHFDKKAIEYVILHELAHLLYPHHQKSFYEYICFYMSDYKQRSALLKAYFYSF